MQKMLEAFTAGSIQHGRDGLRTIRLLPQALHALRVKGVDDIADGLDRTPHELRNGFRRQPTGTRQDDLGPPDTEGVCGASVGLQLHALIIGQGSNTERWFHSPSILLETSLHKNSCGDALGRSICDDLPCYPCLSVHNRDGLLPLVGNYWRLRLLSLCPVPLFSYEEGEKQPWHGSCPCLFLSGSLCTSRQCGVRHPGEQRLCLHQRPMCREKGDFPCRQL
jgi:hypothetical protein